jgi:HEAT repeat protein
MSTYHDPRQDDPRSIDELVSAALSECDEDIAWDAVAALHWRGSAEVLQRARQLCHSPCPQERELGANVLSQLGVPNRTFPLECSELLGEMLHREQSARVLRAVLSATSWHDVPNVVEQAVKFTDHPDASVRHAVVMALTGHEEDLAVQTLIRLTEDSDSHVRDWATFAIGTQSALDTPAIRCALAARLDDLDDDTRGEALVGLARRNDHRVVPALKKELALDYVGYSPVEAAELIRSPELQDLLIQLRDSCDASPESLERAIAACS